MSSTYQYDESIYIKYLFINPVSFFKKMHEKMKKFKFYPLFIMVFYFIKLFKIFATIIGYYYESKMINNMNGQKIK